MAAKTWETDFRYTAICESINEFNNEQRDDLFSFPGSLCIPVAKRPIVGWTPGRIFIIFLVLGFVLLGAGVFVMAKTEPDAKLGNENNAVMVPIGTCLAIAGVACFFVPVMLDRFIMKLVIGSRGAELANRPGNLLCAEISDTDRTKMKMSIDGDDYVLLLADHANQRLLIEGIAARYMIRAKDVTDLRPFQFMNYVGAEITFRINDKTSLSIAIARVSMLFEITRQLPFLFFLRKRIKNRILEVSTEALKLTDEHPVNSVNDCRSRSG
jgi:hypothetical protein